MNEDFTLRPATIQDCNDIYIIINDPAVRKATFKQRKINWEEHKRWFTESLSNPKRLMFIVENNHKNIGIVRFDLKNNHANISIVLDQKSRGQGYGPYIIQSSCHKAYKETKINSFYAYVKSSNELSKKSFAKAGFNYKAKTRVANKNADIFKFSIEN